jgi:GTP-binding protein
VVKTLQAIADANVVVLMLDAHQDISDQDAHIAGFVVEQGRAVVLAVNKWDNLDDDRRTHVKLDVARKMHFMKFASLHYISAIKRSGVGGLMKSVQSAHAAAFRKLSTPKLTRALQAAVAHQAPPRSGLSRPKPRYAHQGGMNPPIVVIHGSGLSNMSPTYTRFLEGRFRETFDLAGTPLRVEYRSTVNPYRRDL